MKNKTFWTNKLDKLFSEIIRGRGACERCGSKKSLQTSHIYSRTNRSVRWSIDNAFCFCAGCHFWWHQHPLEASAFVKEKYGKKKAGALTKKSQQIVKRTVKELEELYNELYERHHLS